MGLRDIARHHPAPSQIGLKQNSCALTYLADTGRNLPGSSGSAQQRYVPAICQFQPGRKVWFRLAEQFLFHMLQGIANLRQDKFIRSIFIVSRHI